MIGRRCALFALGGLLILVLTVNIYFIRMIVESSPEKTDTRNMPVSDDKTNDEQTAAKPNDNNRTVKKSVATEMEERIKAEMRLLPSKYFKRNSSYAVLLDRLLTELKTMPNVQDDIWSIPSNNWPDAHQLLPPAAPELGTILDALRRAKVARADNAPVGTQLKLMLTLEQGVKAMFKPQWYSRDTVLEGPVYYGKDRHNAEVVAFHLSSLLSLRRVPLTVIRKLNLSEEVRSRATPQLYATLYQETNNTCLYGVCHYCSPADPVCGNGDILEGALILWLPSYLKLTKHRHPWQRTYKRNKFALWETDPNYCDRVKESKTYAPQASSRLLDLVDTAVFDFLMDNGDRHHYELPQNIFHNPAVLLIDNGKSLANPDVDHIDILAPLYQCCMIHKTTWDRLRLMSGGALSSSLGRILAHEAAMADVLPLATEDHLSAMDRRLLTIYAVVEYCLKQKKYASNVILDHRKCDGYMLPPTFLVSEGNYPDFVCSKCSARTSWETVVRANAIISMHWESIDQNNLSECDNFFAQWKEVVQKNHFYIIGVEIQLGHLIGFCGSALTKRSDECLRNLLKLCIKLMKILKTLAPAENRMRGMLLHIQSRVHEVLFFRTYPQQHDKQIEFIKGHRKMLNEIYQLLHREPGFCVLDNPEVRFILDEIIRIESSAELSEKLTACSI